MSERTVCPACNTGLINLSTGGEPAYFSLCVFCRGTGFADGIPQWAYDMNLKLDKIWDHLLAGSID